MKKITEYRYNPEKSERLKKERGIDFEDVIALIALGRIVRFKENPNKEIYPHQYMYEIDVDGYIYIVPFVLDGTVGFLKTIYPSRLATKRHRKGK
jgi:hypothetical protein